MDKTGAARVELREDKVDDLSKVKEITPGMIKQVDISVGNREIPLRYTLRTQIEMDEELDLSFEEAQEKIKKKNTKTVVSLMRILGNEGLRLNGKEADLTDEWLTGHIVPANMTAYRIALMGAMTKGWFMETEEVSEAEQDDILAEIRKKNENTD